MNFSSFPGDFIKKSTRQQERAVTWQPWDSPDSSLPAEYTIAALGGSQGPSASGVQAQLWHMNEVIPSSSSSISGLYSPQAELRWPTEHPTLVLPTPGLHDTHGRRTGRGLLQQRVDFSRGCSLLGGHGQPDGLPPPGRMGEQVSTGLLPVMMPHLCSCALFFFILFSGHKLGDVSMQQELRPMIIIFPWWMGSNEV